MIVGATLVFIALQMVVRLCQTPNHRRYSRVDVTAKDGELELSMMSLMEGDSEDEAGGDYWLE